MHLPPAAVLAVLAVVLAAALPVGSASAQVETSACTWRADAQPDDPLAMNTLVVGRFAKTVAAEKEIYQCLDSQGRQTGAIDVETFVELVERLRGGRLTTVAQRLDLVTCIKNRAQLLQSPPRIACKPQTLSPVTLDSRTFAGCAFTTLPREPVQMNTVAVRDGKRRIVKTIKLDKEIFDCDNRIVDVYLFTELTQTPTTSGFRPGPRAFAAIACAKQRTTPGPTPLAPRVSCGRVAV